MTDPSTPVPSDEAVEAAALIVHEVYCDWHGQGRCKGIVDDDRAQAHAALTAAYAIDLPRVRAEVDKLRAENERLRELYENVTGNRERFGWTINHLLECEEALRAAHEYAERIRAEARAATLREVEAWLEAREVGTARIADFHRTLNPEANPDDT